MTFKKLAYLIRNGGRTLAIFGTARLIKNDAGHVELLGGSLDDRRAALEWCSHFQHTATFDVAPPRACRSKATPAHQNTVASIPASQAALAA